MSMMVTVDTSNVHGMKIGAHAELNSHEYDEFL